MNFALFKAIIAGISLLYLLLAIASWVFVFRWYSKTGWRGRAVSVWLQLMSVFIIYYALRGQGDNVLSSLAGLFPLHFVFEIRRIVQFEELFFEILPYVIALVFASFLLLYIFKKLRVFAVVIVTLSSLVGAVFGGDYVSKNAMCVSVKRQGLDSFGRHSFLFSLANAPRDFQNNLHAGLKVDNKRFGWSYKEMDWYLIPANVWGDIPKTTYQC